FGAAALGRLEAALVDCIGPLAPVIVRKAATGATDLPDLYRTLLASVPEAKHAAFARKVGDLAGSTSGPGPASPSEDAPAAAGAPRLSAEILARATDRLTVYIGPVARVMVKRAAEQATSPRDLYQRLSRHIDDPAARARFVASAPDA
ncbi:MAG: hypothetical protein ACREKH_10125, partial [Candidatus Rokuibacteriota bacterium]